MSQSLPTVRFGNIAEPTLSVDLVACHQEITDADGRRLSYTPRFATIARSFAERFAADIADPFAEDVESSEAVRDRWSVLVEGATLKDFAAFAVGMTVATDEAKRAKVLHDAPKGYTIADDRLWTKVHSTNPATVRRTSAKTGKTSEKARRLGDVLVHDQNGRVWALTLSATVAAKTPTSKAGVRLSILLALPRTMLAEAVAK